MIRSGSLGGPEEGTSAGFSQGAVTTSGIAVQSTINPGLGANATDSRVMPSGSLHDAKRMSDGIPAEDDRMVSRQNKSRQKTAQSGMFIPSK